MVCLAAVVVLAAVLRIPLALRPGLWVDEVFSLAMATGHSVEHAAAVARPAAGDLVVSPDARPAAAYSVFAEHEQPPASLGRVLRAVALSDTNPPLYYVLLWAWTRGAGTDDAALRLFSAACAIVCVPLFWVLGRWVHSNAVGLMAAMLFAVSPPALYYSAEGRMYALIWLLSLALAALTIALSLDRANRWLRAAWVVVAAAGLLTHYYFGFVWAACVLWLIVQIGSSGWKQLIALAAASGLAVLPWYARIPETLRSWRVTAGWLDGPLTLEQLGIAPLRLAGELVFWGTPAAARWLAFGMAGVLLLVAFNRRREYVSRRALLLVCWVSASIAGPVVFDLWRGTTTSALFRYALPGLPAAIVLLAVTLAPRRHTGGALLLIALVCCWWPALRETVFTAPARPGQPLLQIARRLDEWASSGSARPLVVMHTVPTGLIGVCRYMTARVPVLGSIVRLRSAPAPAELDVLRQTYGRVALLRLHDFVEPLAIRVWVAWLHEHARLDGGEQMGEAEIQYYVLRDR